MCLRLLFGYSILYFIFWRAIQNLFFHKKDDTKDWPQKIRTIKFFLEYTIYILVAATSFINIFDLKSALGLWASAGLGLVSQTLFSIIFTIMYYVSKRIHESKVKM